MKKLYEFYWNCGRQGDLSGIFVCNDSIISMAIGKRLCFYEPFGKHSEVFGELEEKDLIVLTDDQDFIEKFEKYIRKSFGYNPLNYIEEK